MSMSAIKKSIRDTTRFLSRPNLPADIRREQERKLSALQLSLSGSTSSVVERAMCKKYRMVRFFERKKALRHLAAAQTPEEVSAAQLDLAYVLHFPRSRKYIALYPNNDSKCAKTEGEKEQIRGEIAGRLAVLGEEMLNLQKLKKGSGKVAKAADFEDDDEEDEDEDEEEEDEEEDGEEDSGEEDSGEEDSGEEDCEGEGSADDDEDDSDSESGEEGGEAEGSDDDDESGDEESGDEDSDEDDEEDDDEDDEEFDSDDDDSEEDSDEEDEEESDEEPSTKRTRK